MLLTPGGKRAALGLAAAAALAMTMAACGGEKSGNNGGSTAQPKSSVDSALAAKVPAAGKSAGEIIIGTDSTYAPSEFLDTDGKTIIGFEGGLFKPVAGKLGLQ